MQTDVLILGSGIAGLSTAIKVAEKLPTKKITVVTKSDKSESNTKYAQGGVAAVLSQTDSFDKHIEDTLRAGDYLNDRAVVEKVVRDGPERIQEVIDWGVSFDIDKEGALELGKEGGHSDHRIVHHKDLTGFEIERALISKIESLPNITVLQHHFAIELITNRNLDKKPAPDACWGAYILNEETAEVETHTASFTCLATGGIGQVYKYTTNPVIATGDGIAMAFRAGAQIRGMEFIQFHPTALYDPSVSPSFLISEAVRGFGAHLKNEEGERFMFRYDERGELASRDIVSRAIDSELKKSLAACVYLDARHTDFEKFKTLFPTIYNRCLSIGIDPERSMIPVVPVMHYLCGGIATDLRGRTSLRNLYACGECADTGLHGANRLASNSLLEALVFAHEVATDIVHRQASAPSIPNIRLWSETGVSMPREQILIRQNKEEIQNLMSNYVAIVRSNERLKQAVERIEIIYRETETFYKKSKVSTALGELRNLVTIAYLIVRQSSERAENKGAFFNQDLVK